MRKSTSIDARLQGVLSYLCDREEISPETLKGKLFPNNSKEIAELRETINYLKDYVKIQTVAKALSGNEELEKDIVEAKEYLQSLIAQTQKEIETLPKAPKKRRDISLLYEFEEESKGFDEVWIAKARETRKNKLLELRANIRNYKAKIKQIESIQKTLTNPKKVVEQLFPEEEMKTKGEYGRLVNLCAISMNSGLRGRKLVNNSDVKDGVFDYDSESRTYTVNQRNARKFISVLKSRKEIISISQYAKALKELRTIDEEYNANIQNKNDYEFAEKVVGTNAFKNVTRRMNEVMSMYDNLIRYEEKTYNHDFIGKIERRIRRLFDLKDKVRVPRRVIRRRKELSKRIDSLLKYIDKSNATKKAYKAFLIARRGIDSIDELDVDSLRMLKYKLEGHGYEGADITTEQADVEQLKINLQLWKEDTHSKTDGIIEMKKKKEEEVSTLFSGLSPKAKKILETETPENVLEYARKYYGFDKEHGVDFSRGISASAAAIILESILKRKNLSWDEMFSVYADSLGGTKKQEDIDLSRIMSEKTDLVRKMVSSIVGERAEINVEREER